MDENTIFQKDNAGNVLPNQPSQPPVSVGTQPSAPQVSTQPVVPPAVQPIISFQQAPADPSEIEEETSFFSRFSLGSLIKVLIGFFVVVVLVFLLMRFVVPLFTGSNKERVALNYWGLWEDSQVMGDIIKEFEKQNPMITVTYTKMDVKQYAQTLGTRVNNGSGPDVFRFHNTWTPQLEDILLPVPSEVITNEVFSKTYYPVMQNDLIIKGAIYGIPLEIDTLALFVNTDILQAAGVSPPTSWDEFVQAAGLLTVKDVTGKITTAGAGMGTYDNVTHASDIVSLLFAQNGANIQDLSSTPQHASDALTFYTEFAIGFENVWDETLDDSRTAFANGSLAMFFGYSWDVLLIKAMNPSLSFQIVSVPHVPPPSKPYTIASYWVEGVSAKSKHQKEAFTFISYLAKKETSQKLFTQQSKTRLFGEPYARVDLAESLQSNTLLFPFVSQAKSAISSFFVSDTYDQGLNDQMNAYLGNAVRSILANTSPQSAVETLAKGVAQVQSQYAK